MKVNTSWNLGRFNIALSSEVDESMRDQLASFGLRFLGQRNSEVDKILGGFTTNEKGKQERIKGFKRNEVDFSSDLAAALALSFEELGLPDSEEKIAAEVVVGESTATAADVKMADERAAYARHSGDLAAFAAKVGYAGEVGDGKAENAPVEYLRAIRAYVKAQLAAL